MSGEGRFVGRSAELEELEGRLADAAGGRGGVVVLSGEGGMGKTRLCAELAESARRLGITTAWVTCWEAAGMPPNWPWHQLLRQLGVDPPDYAVNRAEPELARRESIATMIERVRAVAATEPVLLVLDDAQWADTATLRILAHAAPQLRSTRALLVACVRADDWITPLPAEVIRAARRIVISGLDTSDVEMLIADVIGMRPATGVAAVLHDQTAGNPLFAMELARQLHGMGRIADGATLRISRLPPTVRAVLGERLAGIRDRCRELLSVAAVIGREFSVALLDAASLSNQVDIMADIEEAIAHGVVHREGLDRYRFAHPLLCSVVVDELTPNERLALHRQVAEAIERRAQHGNPADTAALSFHYLNAIPLVEPSTAVRYTCEAARSAMELHAYEEAAQLYDRALTALTFDPTQPDRASILVSLGHALAAAGDSAPARATFLDAAEVARARGEKSTLALAALGLAGTGFEVALFDDQQIALLEEALESVEGTDALVEAMICARLCVALSLSGCEDRRRVLADNAVRLARSAGDGVTLAHALAARCDTIAGPADTARRMLDATEIIRLAAGQGAVATELLGHRLKLVAAVGTGDLHLVDAETHAFEQRAKRMHQAHFDWLALLWRAMASAARGNIDAQRALTADAERVAQRAASANSDILLFGQRWLTQIEVGEIEDASARFDLALPPGSYEELGVRMLPTVAMQRVLLGRPEDARRMLDSAADDLRAMDRDSEWLTTLTQIADICFSLEGHELATWLYNSLLPYGDQWAVEGIGAYTHGSVQRHLGQLATLIGEPGAAAAHFDAAINSNALAGADLLVARTFLDRGIGLGDRASLHSALERYDALGIERRARQARALLAQGGPARLQPRDTRPPRTGPTALFAQNGDVWQLTYGDHSCTIRDAKGLHDIARLLAEPRRELAALDLFGPEASRLPRGHLGETVDASARAAYKRRLIELQGDLDDADAAADSEGSARLQAEYDAILEQLTSAYGLGGRTRRAGDPAERARTAVTARIRYAIRGIAKVNPALGRHLSNSISTGVFCCYDPDTTIEWAL